MLIVPVFLMLAVLTALGVGTLALGVECNLSRRALRRTVPRSILDVRLACRLSKFASSCEMALAIWAQSNGWRDRRISLVACGSWHAPRTTDRRLVGRGRCDFAQWIGVFSENGSDDCGCCVKSIRFR